jgi:hypothetical protein
MTRYKDQVGVTPAALRDYANLLRQFADTHVELAEWIEKSGFDEVRAKNLKTGVSALVDIGKFLGAVVAAHCENEAALGVKEIVGASALVRRTAMRLKDELEEPIEPVALAGEAIRRAKKIKKGGTNAGTGKP